MKTAYKTVECYQTYDGKLFTSEKEANEHADDILGQELDGLLRIAELDISRSQEYTTILAWMKDREKLKGIINKLHDILHFENDVE